MNLPDTMDKNTPILVMGDFNKLAAAACIEFLSDKYGLTQLVTKPTTDNDSKLDLVFTNISLASIKTGLIEMRWTDHKFVWSSINL